MRVNACLLFCLALAWTVSAGAGAISGQSLAAQHCAACHGADGKQTAAEQFPRLAGQQIPYLIQELKDYRDARRSDELMQAAVRGLKDDEIQTLAEWYGNLPPMVATSTRPELLAQGRKLYFEGNDDSGVPACNGCHEDDGAGYKSAPRVAGQSPAYTLAAFERYVSGKRPFGKKVMRTVAARLSAPEMAAVAEFMATLK